MSTDVMLSITGMTFDMTADMPALIAGSTEMLGDIAAI